MGRFVILLALCLTISCLRGEENAATSAPPPSPSPIESAKRDYAAIKASRVTIEQQRLKLPTGATPELRLSGDPAQLGSAMPARQGKDSSKEAALQRGKASNWLVDAMGGAKTPATREAASLRDYLSVDQGETGEAAAHKSGETDASMRRGEKSVQTPKSNTRAANPLENYLAAWMTPGDYQLLRIDSSESGKGLELSAGTPARDLTDQLNFPTSQRPTGPTESGLVTHPSQGFLPSTAAPQANPYLSEVPLGNRDLAPPAAAGIPTPPALQPAALGSQEPRPVPAQTPADLLKARDDARYFPQLKRF